MERLKLITAVHLFLIRENKILLLRRYNTGFQDGNYSVIAGHLDGNESATNAMLRETQEESGIIIDTNDLRLVHAMHRKSEHERIDLFFTATNYQGEVQNMEPNKCDDLSWYPINNLPNNMVPYVRKAIENYFEGIIYSEFGWE